MTAFLILGGTGKVGRRLATHLESAGMRVRAVGRQTAIPFDWNDPTTWGAALEDITGVFIVGPGSARDWSPALTAFLDRALDAGVTHAVLLSARGVEFLPDGNVARAEAAIARSPIPQTILRPTHFAQNFTEAMFVPRDGRVRAPLGEGLEPFIDVRDIVEVAATVLIESASAAGTIHTGVIELSGPRALSMTRALGMIAAATGIPARFDNEDEDSHRESMRAAGVPEEYIRWRLAMLRGIRDGEDAYLSTGVRTVLGREATSFADWIEREVRTR
ncbi:hypothetical protein [Mycetocola saprophilus]|uniref:hypothetical protein n=1 Tax=Mycetocola saprophilus TaxID=76636 RepID=UPI003BF1B6F3